MSSIAPKVGQVRYDKSRDRWLLITSIWSHYQDEVYCEARRVVPDPDGQGWRWSAHGPYVYRWRTDIRAGRGSTTMRDKQMSRLPIADEDATQKQEEAP